jgi:aconitate decarboxylase
MGTECALLARAGFTASQSIFEAPSGFDEVFGAGTLDLGRLCDNFASPRALIDPGLAHKRWPAHTAMQVAISAGLALHEPGHVPSTIQIRSPCLPYCDRPAPKSTNAARFSFQYAVAVAVLDGEVGMASFTQDRLRDPVLQSLLRRTQNIQDPTIPTPFTEMWVEVAIDGARTHRADTWRGHWREPMTDEELSAKFRSCAAHVLAEAEVTSAHDGLKVLEQPAALEQVLTALRVPAL